MSENKPHFLIEIKQVGNGFFLSITNCSTYDKSESVHVTIDEVTTAIDKALDFVKSSFRSLPPAIMRDATPLDNEVLF